MNARPPRLVALRLSAGPAEHEAPHPWDRVREVWAQRDAVLPLPAAEREAARLVDALRPDVVVEPAEGRGSEPPGQPPPDGCPALAPSTALVVATSGSTGSPRGVALSHAAVDAAVQASLARTGAGEGDRWLCCLPLEHVAGLLVLARAHAAGSSAVVHDRFDVAAVGAALAGPAPPTQLSLVPTMLHRLLDAGVDLHPLRCVLLGGARADPVLLERAHDAGARVVTTYGMTETCGGIVYDGLPLDGAGVAVEPDGRILLSGPTLATGYRDGGRLPMVDGWFRTADHGSWGPDGRLDVRGRLDDVVITGGENVDTASVAGVLRAHPRVREAAVAGIPDPDWGARIEGWVVPLDDELDLAALASYLAGRLPPFAVPKRLHVVAALPRATLGKVARSDLAGLRPARTWPPPPDGGATRPRSS